MKLALDLPYTTLNKTRQSLRILHHNLNSQYSSQPPHCTCHLVASASLPGSASPSDPHLSDQYPASSNSLQDDPVELCREVQSCPGLLSKPMRPVPLYSSCASQFS